MGALASALLSAAPALADSEFVGLTALHTTSIEVTGSNLEYTAVKPLSVISVEFTLKTNAGESGRLKGYKVWLELGSTTGSIPGFEYPMPDHYHKKTFPVGKRPKIHGDKGALVVPALAWQDFVVAQCNGLVADLRKDGQSDDQIFRKDRTTSIKVRAVMKAEFSGIAGPNDYADDPDNIGYIKVVCKAQVKSTVFDPDALLPVVTEAGLQLAKTTIKKSCPLDLGAAVQFRGGREGQFQYRLRFTDNRYMGPFTGTMTRQPSGDYRFGTTHKITVPLPPGGHAGAGSFTGLPQDKPGGPGSTPGGLAAQQTPEDLHKLGLRVEVLGDPQVKSDWATEIVDCRKKPIVTIWSGGVTPKKHKGVCPATATLSLQFRGGRAGDFTYVIKVFNVDASHGGGLETLGGVHIANVGPFKGKMTQMPDGSFRTSAVQNLQFPLKKTQGQIGGYAASASKPSGKTTYRFKVVFPSQAHEPMQEHGTVPFEYTQDCGPARNPAVAGGPGGLAQTDRPNTAPGSGSTSQMLPDLKLVKVKKSFKPFELLVQVANNSFLTTKPTQLRATYKQGGANKQKVTVKVPPLKPGASKWIPVTFKAPVAQADSIHIQLDPNNTVKEAKETNNAAVYQP
ncbi:CARDB domain-containing protein [Pelagibius sp.]|uniref:CARDB domain-containing protein n=1 Tax=Pelagibius sp. TaxID=1931238 RepID=UPI0026070EF7|nr:CARDB domain-containing protein [Pelagibius sp.]